MLDDQRLSREAARYDFQADASLERSLFRMSRATRSHLRGNMSYNVLMLTRSASRTTTATANTEGQCILGIGGAGS
jgi:hypothetical protein